MLRRLEVTHWRCVLLKAKVFIFLSLCRLCSPRWQSSPDTSHSSQNLDSVCAAAAAGVFLIRFLFVCLLHPLSTYPSNCLHLSCL